MQNLMRKIILYQLILVLAGSQFVYAQNLVEANPANIHDPGSAFINPAVIMSQSKQVFAGIRIFQMGFLDNNSTAFKHSFLTYSQPFSRMPRMGYGITAQYLHTPYFTQGNYSLLVARRFSEIVTLGTRVNWFTKGYNLRDANLEIEDDPVFRDNRTKHVFSLGFGFLLGPVSNLTVGIGLDHVNRPNVSLSGNELRQPITFDFGIHYLFNFIGPSLYVNYQDNQTVTTFGLEAQHFSLGTLGLYYGKRSVILEGRLNLLRNRMSIGYRMDFPLQDLVSYSVGTHLLSVSYRFAEPIDSDFNIISTVDNLNVVEKRISVEADKGITVRDIEALAEYKLDIFDQQSLERIKESAKVVGIQNLGDRSGAQLDDASYKYYKKTLIEMVEKKMKQTGGTAFKVDINSPPGTGQRALALLNFLVDSLGFPSQNVNIVFAEDYNDPNWNQHNIILEALKTSISDAKGLMKRIKIPIPGKILLSDDQTVFEIKRIQSTKPVHSWRIVIESRGDVIKRFAGFKDPRATAWDWKDDDDNLIKPGEYFYYFQWRDKATGDWKPSRPNKKVIFVDKEVQTERIFLTKDGQPPMEDPNIETEKVEVLLKSKKSTETTSK